MTPDRIARTLLLGARGVDVDDGGLRLLGHRGEREKNVGAGLRHLPGLVAGRNARISRQGQHRDGEDRSQKRHAASRGQTSGRDTFSHESGRRCRGVAVTDEGYVDLRRLGIALIRPRFARPPSPVQTGEGHALLVVRNIVNFATGRRQRLSAAKPEMIEAIAYAAAASSPSTGPNGLPLASTSRSTNSITASAALSP